MKTLVKIFLAVIILSLGLVSPDDASADDAILSITPSTGRFVVDSTFEAPIYLNTGPHSINTVELSIKFPPDKLQLVSSSTGKSIIGIWATLPKFNNQTGTVELTGGIPGGIKVSQGLITVLTFRVKAVGTAIVKFNSSNVLLHDGNGTELLTRNQNSIYDLVLPPPAGPVVVSDTHPDQTKWYKSPNASLKWGDEGGTDGYSYIVSDSPTDIPDDVSEGTQQSIVYRNLSEGRHYFHVKGLRSNQWGGVTHYGLNVDTNPPAEFSIEFIPSAKTSRSQPLINFETTDNGSGLSHYELKIIPLSDPNSDQKFFIEATSPFVPNQLPHGKYDVIVRAFDEAGNYREIVERLNIVPALFRNVGDSGLEFRSTLVLPWVIVWAVLIVVLLLLLYISYRLVRRHRLLHHQLNTGALPADLERQLTELQNYRDKYGKIGLFFLAIFLSSIMFASDALAQNSGRLSSPLITTVSNDISNEEILYAGGKTDIENAQIILYIENSQTSESMQETVAVDKNGEWFYRHDSFLPPGTYILWAQAKVGNELSPPSPQVSVNVIKTAVQFGVTKLSYAAIYLTLLIIFALLLVGILIFIFYHLRHARKKHRLLLKEIGEAESSIRRGFAVLNRDIKAELEIIHRMKMSKGLSEEESQREELLLKDLNEIEQYVTKEVWDIQETERT